MSKETKKALFEACQAYVQDRIRTSEAAIEAAQQAANSETKSSMGDKYETGRAMMQRERDKATIQLAEAMKLETVLKEVDPAVLHEQAELGSVVETSRGKFFISVAAGMLKVKAGNYFAVSPASPIGKKLLGTTVGDEIEVDGNRFKVVRLF